MDQDDTRYHKGFRGLEAWGNEIQKDRYVNIGNFETFNVFIPTCAQHARSTSPN